MSDNFRHLVDPSQLSAGDRCIIRNGDGRVFVATDRIMQGLRIFRPEDNYPNPDLYGWMRGDVLTDHPVYIKVWVNNGDGTRHTEDYLVSQELAN